MDRIPHKIRSSAFMTLIFLTSTLSMAADAAESTCFGAPNHGRLEGGVKIPESGSNFSFYSSLSVSLGRTYVHSKVAEVIAASYAALAVELPDKVFVEAIAEHLYAVYTAARKQDVGVSRVIFEPNFLPKLYSTRRGDFLKMHISFMQGRAWIRHDEHYHIDFSVPCKPLQS